MLKQFKSRKIQIAVLGGDGRAPGLAERLAAAGAGIITYGLGNAVPGCDRADTLEAALSSATAVILPTPAFKDGRLFCPAEPEMSRDENEVWEKIPPGAAVFGGRLTGESLARARQHGIEPVDYMALEEIQYRNAVITAEGAIYLAMRALPVTLDGARVAVLGYGRIGEALTRRLSALGAQVTVAVRKARDVARVEGLHADVLIIREEEDNFGLEALEKGYDVIFNTVPARILTAEIVSRLPDATALLELASAPGGWDVSVPCRCKQILAPGLPGKYAPVSAGRVIAESLIPLIGEVVT